MRICARSDRAEIPLARTSTSNSPDRFVMRTFITVLALATLTAACADAPADRPTMDDAAPSIAAPQDIELSRELLESWAASLENVARLAASDTAIAAAMNSDASESPDSAIMRLEAIPEAREAIERGGITVEQYVLTSMSLFSAMFARAALEQGMIEELPPEVDRDNVEFVEENAAWIEELVQRLQQLQAELGGVPAE
jgi:hypothetical protein